MEDTTGTRSEPWLGLFPQISSNSKSSRSHDGEAGEYVELAYWHVRELAGL